MSRRRGTERSLKALRRVISPRNRATITCTPAGYLTRKGSLGLALPLLVQLCCRLLRPTFGSGTFISLVAAVALGQRVWFFGSSLASDTWLDVRLGGSGIGDITSATKKGLAMDANIRHVLRRELVTTELKR